MKRTLALLLVAVMAITCTLAALSVSAEVAYKDVVNLLPASESAIQIYGGIPTYSLKDGKLSLTRSEESPIAWPSIVYDVNKEVDLDETPYLHMSFETSGEGDRGVNGFIYYNVNNGDEESVQLSAIGGNGVDDFRDTDDMYIDLAEYLGISGKVNIVKITLSVYGGVGETIIWNALALAAEDTVEEPQPEEPAAPVTVTVIKGDVKFNEETLDKLVDGDRDLGATAFGSAGLISFQNPGFKDGNATVEIVVDLGEVKTAGSVYADFFRDDNDTTGSFISLPSAVELTVSANGKDYYDVNAGNAVAIAEGEDVKMNTIAVDFSTRIALNVRYIKAVVTFDNEWIFLSEIGIGAASESGIPMNPAAPFAYTEGETPRYGIGLYTEAGDYDLSDNSEGVYFQNAQIIIAAWDETTEAYKIIRNTVNPWPNGYDETVTLKEGEILLAIATQGNINAGNEDDTIFAGLKWIVRGMKEGDYVVLDTENKTATFYPSTHDFTAPSEPVDPPTTSDPDDTDSSSTDPGNTGSGDTGSGDKAPTGDQGILVFAVLGMVALAGAAVAVKVRH